MACAYNNVAVDELSKRIKQMGGDGLTVVRLGEPGRSDPEARALALSALEGKEAADIRRRLEEVHAAVEEGRVARERWHSRWEASSAEAAQAHKMVEMIRAAQAKTLEGKASKLRSGECGTSSCKDFKWLEQQLVRARALLSEAQQQQQLGSAGARRVCPDEAESLVRVNMAGLQRALYSLRHWRQSDCRATESEAKEAAGSLLGRVTIYDREHPHSCASTAVLRLAA